MVVDGVQDQHSAVGGLTSHSPLMEEIDRVTFNIGAIERPDGHHRDLGMRLLVDLPADIIHLRDRALIQNVGKIVDVVGGFELSDGFGLRCQNQQQRAKQTEPPFCVSAHRIKIVQDEARAKARRLDKMRFRNRKCFHGIKSP